MKWKEGIMMNRISSYKFIGKLTLLVCLLNIIFMFMMSFSLLPYNAATPLITALAQYPFFPFVYGVIFLLTIFLGILSLLRFRQNTKNKMFLIHLIYAILIIVLLIHGFDLVRMCTYLLIGKTSALQVMVSAYNDNTLLSHLMSMLFGYLTCGYLSLGMALISLVLQLQIAGKLYFPRSEVGE